MGNHFRASSFLLPKKCQYDKWAVIACDQHTSEPEYWEQVRTIINDAPSTLDLFFPEAELNKLTADSLSLFSDKMRSYIAHDFFREHHNSYIYVERTLQNGHIRPGIIGVIDLEYYDYSPQKHTKVFATEATVLQRVPPRIALRKKADLEFSHTVIFCDDPSKSLIEPITQNRDSLQKLYDFNLMTGGGRICGYLLHEDLAHAFDNAIAEYERDHAYLVGDGNHSLVTAKLTYEAFKEEHPEVDWEDHPARYAMVELENIHSDAMVFEPIYRIAVSDDPLNLIHELLTLNTDNGVPVTWIHGDQTGCVHLPVAAGELPIAALQRFLDHWIESNTGSIDYIHGKDTVRKLAQRPNTVGFLLPDMDKNMLFPYILSGKVMPKKTFSIGRAEEKRYYLEGRKIK